MTASLPRTPYYVLLNATCRQGPAVMKLPLGRACVAIYGFSDKGPYDAFCRASDLPLRPYPLVKGYLRTEASALGDSLGLVVLDAAGPNESVVDATTIEAVLEAQEHHSAQLTATYRLSLDIETNKYRVECVSSGIT